MPHILPVTVYYEDTDFTGVVYHANYVKFYERAREELLGVDKLAALYREKGYGFVVYRIELKFKEGAVHGDRLEVRTVGRAESDYRCVFDQQIWRVGGATALVTGTVEMVVVDKANKLVPIPAEILAWIRSAGAGT